MTRSLSYARRFLVLLSIALASIALPACGSAGSPSTREVTGRSIAVAGAPPPSSGAEVARAAIPPLLLYLAGRLPASRIPALSPELQTALAHSADRAAGEVGRLASFTVSESTPALVRAEAKAHTPSGRSFSIFLTVQLDAGTWRITDLSDG